MSKRIQWIDGLKGLAILLVMISHGCGIPVIGQYLYACYMPVFFILSGYTFSWKTNMDTLTWIKGKAKRMLVPYFIYGIILVTVNVCLNLLTTGLNLRNLAFDYLGILYSRHHLFVDLPDKVALMSGLEAPLWFLTCMFVSWLFFLILYKANNVCRITLLSLYLVASGAMMYLPILLPWSIDTALVGTVFIFIGYKISEINMHIHSKPKAKIAIAIAIAISLLSYILLVYFNGYTNMSIRIYGNKGILSLPIFIAIGVIGTFLYATICILFEKIIIGKILAFIGKNTITVLGTHMFIFIVINKIFEALSLNLSIYIIGIIQITVSLAAVYIIKKIFFAFENKIPIVKYL